MLNSKISSGLIGIVLTLLLFAPPTQADPCGMVPPIYTGPGSPITRIGLQQTYVFHKDGIETFVIRPGFEGKVDNFGMLIPFPNPPALRKVPDNVFQQLANAIDPPEVVVDLDIMYGRLALSAGGGGAELKGGLAFGAMQKESVVVLKQEAVGMYEVAVLQAGSAQALKRWMDQNKFVYPDGMDAVTEDYIEQKWCFVAVKTKVGSKGAVNPAPGQRQVDSALPAGSVFDGNVQGMGFRFKSDELVVPMRLSAFNPGKLRNVVYVLTDQPKKIRSIPEQFVVRQVKGQQLHDNLTQPLPLRIIGGTLKDVPEWQKKNLKTRRDPKPRNGVAAELFASDLLAVATGELSLGHEETEKEYLRIGEYFGLRGADYDLDIASASKAATDKTVQAALQSLKSMTLTVIDGDFPREVIAKENLTFARYNMPEQQNRTEMYDAKLNEKPPKLEGKRVSDADFEKFINGDVETDRRTRIASMLPLAVLLGLSWLASPGRRRRDRSPLATD